MHTQIRTQPHEIKTVLDRIGLTVEELKAAAQSGYLAFASCTDNDAPFFPGLAAWARTVRTLRELLLVKGWSKRDDGNYSLTVHPDNKIAIAVSTGDENTGFPDSIPSTKAPKGQRTKSAVTSNERQLSLFPDWVPEQATPENIDFITWIFLVHRTDQVVRSELSLPVGFSGLGRVSAWRERIILPEFEIDPSNLMELPEEFAPESEIKIARRA